MRSLKELVFTCAMIAGLSLAASAQKNDTKKPPPKNNPPVINPQPKQPRDSKPKKPGSGFAFVLWIRPENKA